MRNQTNKTRSALARALERLLRESDLYKLEEWGDILGVSQPAISQWLHDKTLPRPELLRMIRRVVGEHTNVPVRILADFDGLLRQPAERISPHAGKIGLSLGHYLLKPDWEAFERCTLPLSPDDQKSVLQAASSHAQRIAWNAEQVETFELDEAAVGERPAGGAMAGRLTSRDLQRLKIEERNPNPSIWELAGHIQQELLQPTKPLQLVSESAPRFEVLSGLFAVDERQHTSLRDDVFNFAALPWVLPVEKEFGGFACDEMQIVLQQGTIEISYDGIPSHSAVISGKPHAPGLLRMIAPPSWEHGLPPFSLKTLSSEPGLALAVFYARDGLNLSRLDEGLDRASSPLEVELEAHQWPKEQVAQFWKESGPWGELLPLSGNIFEDEDRLDQWMEENPLSKDEQRGKHRSSRDKGQVLDCNWREWLKGAAISGIDTELGAIHTRILKFPAIPNLPEEEICGDAHAGSEILIPLRGAFNYLYAQIENIELEANFDNFGEFAQSRERRGKSLKLWRGHAQSAFVSGKKFSDIVFVESSAYHGFHGVGNEAYCLHIRCLADATRLLKNRREKKGTVTGAQARVGQRSVA